MGTWPSRLEESRIRDWKIWLSPAGLGPSEDCAGQEFSHQMSLRIFPPSNLQTFQFCSSSDYPEITAGVKQPRIPLLRDIRPWFCYLSCTKTVSCVFIPCSTKCMLFPRILKSCSTTVSFDRSNVIITCTGLFFVWSLCLSRLCVGI